MNVFLFLYFLFAMVPGVDAYQDVSSNNAIRKSEHKRVKRDFVNNGECAEGFKNLIKCVPFELYNESQADDYNEIQTESQDVKVTSPPTPAPVYRTLTARAETTTPHTEPMSDPYRTPHSQTSQNQNVTSSLPGPMTSPDGTPQPQTWSSSRPTKRTLYSPRTRSTSQSSSKPGPTTTSRPAPVPVSGAESTFSHNAMKATILLMLWIHLAV